MNIILLVNLRFEKKVLIKGILGTFVKKPTISGDRLVADWKLGTIVKQIVSSNGCQYFTIGKFNWKLNGETKGSIDSLDWD